jgi:hypothetical protein
MKSSGQPRFCAGNISHVDIAAIDFSEGLARFLKRSKLNAERELRITEVKNTGEATRAFTGW